MGDAPHLWLVNQKYEKPQHVTIDIDEQAEDPRNGRPIHNIATVQPALGLVEKEEVAYNFGVVDGQEGYEKALEQMDTNPEVYEPWQKGTEPIKMEAPKLFLPMSYCKSEAERLGVSLGQYQKQRSL